MRASFAFVFYNKENVKNIVALAEKHFKLSQEEITKNYIDLVDIDNEYSLSISDKKIEFSITYGNNKSLDNSIKKIKDFLSNNFYNKVVGVSYYSEDLINNIFDDTKNVNIIRIN